MGKARPKDLRIASKTQEDALGGCDPCIESIFVEVGYFKKAAGIPNALSALECLQRVDRLHARKSSHGMNHNPILDDPDGIRLKRWVEGDKDIRQALVEDGQTVDPKRYGSLTQNLIQRAGNGKVECAPGSLGPGQKFGIRMHRHTITSEGNRR